MGPDLTEFEDEVTKTVQEMLPDMKHLATKSNTGRTGQEAFSQIRILQAAFKNSDETKAVIQVCNHYTHNQKKHNISELFFLAASGTLQLMVFTTVQASMQSMSRKIKTPL